MTLVLGPRTQQQLIELSNTWKQGQHVLITGPTGSGKTRLARELDEIRINHGGFVVVFIAKIRPDKTITDDYRGWTRWTRWKTRPNRFENRILLWPDVERMNPGEALGHMKFIFSEALDHIGKTGKWTVHIDEGLTTTHREYMNLGTVVGLMYTFMRSAHGTMITLAQRPSHLPLTVYTNATHVFAGNATETTDLKRLSEIDGKQSAKALATQISHNGLHDFTWIRAHSDKPPEQVNLAK